MRCMRSTVLNLSLLAAFVAATIDSAQAANESRPAQAPPPEALLAEIAFDDDAEPNRIVIDLAPDESPSFKLMVDTGASRSVLTPSAARELGVSIRRLKSSPYRRKTRLGRDLQFYVDTSSSDTGSKTGFEYGLLGANFLHHYVVEFDFANRWVRFYDPEKYELPENTDSPGEAILGLELINNRPALEVDYGETSLSSLIDTGANSSFIVGGNAAERAGIDVRHLPKYRPLGTVRGKVPTRIDTAGAWSVGPFEFVDSPVIVATRGWHNQVTRDQSVIGYDALQQFTLRIDYPRKRVWMRRETDVNTVEGLD